MKAKRCIVLIDGSNFYYKLKDLGLHHLLDFNFAGFAKNLAGTDKLINAVYYIGKIRTDGSKRAQELFDSQQKLLSHLKHHNYRYSLGYLLKSDGEFHEKGVDVNMAVDILVAVYENLCDDIFLVSSDTDLLPAVKKAKDKRKMVAYIGFSHKPSVAMVANCSSSRLLTKDDIQSFIMSDKEDVGK